jgi:hypothetical protein
MVLAREPRGLNRYNDIENAAAHIHGMFDALAHYK